jgi:hypothetical protein
VEYDGSTSYIRSLQTKLMLHDVHDFLQRPVLISVKLSDQSTERLPAHLRIRVSGHKNHIAHGSSLACWTAWSSGAGGGA